MLSSSPAAQLDRQAGGLSVLSIDGVGDAQRWVADNRDAIRATVTGQGSVMIRGLGLRDAADAGAVFRQLAPAGLMTEREAFASRQSYSQGVYSSSKWPANQPMCMHHELSYLLEPPILMMFACINAPATGGATAVADSTAVLRALPAGLVERFEREGWLLIRSYNDELGASPADAFGTDDPRVIESYCRANRIDFEWLPDGGLRTWQRRSAVVRHPVSGARCWFNQIGFLNEWTMAPEVHEYLVDVYGRDGCRSTPGSGMATRSARTSCNCSTTRMRSIPSGNPGGPVTCCSSTTSAPRTAGNRSPDRVTSSSG